MPRQRLTDRVTRPRPSGPTGETPATPADPARARARAKAWLQRLLAEGERAEQPPAPPPRPAAKSGDNGR
jgi:hypothetical protein